MKLQHFVFTFMVALMLTMTLLTQPTMAAKGGCIGCTMVVSIIEQIAETQGGDFTIPQAISLWCEALGGEQHWIVTACTKAVGALAPTIAADWKNNLVPDQTCAKLSMCKDDDLKCSLWTPKNTFSAQEYQSDIDIQPFQELFAEADSIFTFVMESAFSWSELGKIKPLDEYASILKHKPMEEQKLDEAKWYLRAWLDTDKDGFSQFQHLRGWNWRGKDSNDLDPKVYPGRKTNDKGPNNDHNSNGIFGTNPATGKSYEEELCSGTPQFNFVALGDSATAHFSLPPCWLSGKCIKKGTYDQLLNIAMDEMDFPQCSSITGFNATGCPSLDQSITKFTSLYSYARSLNPCVHRAYQNIGVNGARSTSMAPGPTNSGIINSFTPDPDNDHKYAVVLSLIGNDVCNKSPEISSMTSEQDYHDSMIDSLNYLDAVLPQGSHVFIGGLVRGSSLFDVMGNEDHPIGPIKYSRFYDYLNCFETSPCAGWLNSDASIRKRTDEHAIKLNYILQSIASTMKFKNFTLRYNNIFGIIDRIMADFKAKNIPLTKVIEQTDGFHPSSTTQSLIAQSMINTITASAANGSEIFTPNPNASKIAAIFGQQLNGY